MTLHSLEDAFANELRDILSAERQMSKVLPKLAKCATSDRLRAAIEHHVKETHEHVDRLEQVFKSLERSPRSKKCEAMEGLVKEAASVIDEQADDQVKDAMIIAAIQKVEHYEIATYGTLCTWARLLCHGSALGLLKETMSEEVIADSLLSEIAESVNVCAMEEATAGTMEEEEEE
ncbi:ferritin-like domain-containing protein [Planctomicrobium sp. SH527]|uniref:YciE/YciF ferroxidase family protein n=1 Tax=Planctomicrobium sp. SH527 TaxID=3448123 RepID=UPI003F5C2DB8